jgi:hypothetical protein
MARIKKERVSFTIEGESIKLMDYYAGNLHRSRAELMRALLNLALDNREIMNAVGIFKMDSLRERGVIVQLPLGHYE